MFWIVFLLIFLPTVSSLATKCDKMDVTTTWIDGISLGSIKVGMEIIGDQNSNTSVNVTYREVNLPDGSPIHNFTWFCEDYPHQQCIRFTNNTVFMFPATNTTIWLSARFYLYSPTTDYIFNITVDEGTFSMSNKSLFSPSQDTFIISDYSLQTKTDRTIVYQCKSFIAVPESQVVVPRCNAFRSRTTLLDAQNNYKILSTIKVIYEMYKNKTLVFAEVNDTAYNEYALDNYAFPYVKHDCWIHVNDPVNCTYPFTYDNGTKVLFGFHMVGGYQNDNIKTPTYLIGRILNRNGLTLMEEGRPFTLQDNCIYFSNFVTNALDFMDPLKGSYAIASEFCCTAFEQ